MSAGRKIVSSALTMLLALALLIPGLGWPSQASASTSAPTATTVSATDIQEDEATLNGEISSDGNSDITQYGFYYGTTISCSNKIKVGTSIDEDDDFDYTLTDLEEDTTYYYKAYARNDEGTDYGAVKSFTTDEDSDDSLPDVTTKTPSTGSGSATLYGVVTSTGDSDIESYGFYYGTSSSPGTKVEVDDDAIDEDETFSYDLTGLSPGATYYVKAYATNDDGTSYGSVLSFQVNNNANFTPGPPSNPSMLYIGSKDYKIKGTQQHGDVAPFIDNGRTFLPIRPVANALGISDNDISWDAQTQTVTLKKDGKVVKLQVNSNIMDNNGQSVKMDAAPRISGGRTCLPIAQLAQAFGANVAWDARTQTVTIK